MVLVFKAFVTEMRSVSLSYVQRTVRKPGKEDKRRTDRKHPWTRSTPLTTPTPATPWHSPSNRLNNAVHTDHRSGHGEIWHRQGSKGRKHIMLWRRVLSGLGLGSEHNAVEEKVVGPSTHPLAYFPSSSGQLGSK